MKIRSFYLTDSLMLCYIHLKKNTIEAFILEVYSSNCR